MIILACNTCTYISKPTKNESHNINQANYNARQAHAPQTAMVVQRTEQADLPGTAPNSAMALSHHASGQASANQNAITTGPQSYQTDSSAFQSTINAERTVGQKRDRRDTKEFVTIKRKEYHQDGTLKAEVEESKETTDRGESESTETKELLSQVLQLKQERAVYEMKVEQTFTRRLKEEVKAGVEAGIKARLKAEEQTHALRMDEHIMRQAMGAKGKDAKPLDIFFLAKVVQKQRGLIGDLVDEAAATAWLADNAEDFTSTKLDALDAIEDDLSGIGDAQFAKRLPLLTTLGFSKAALETLGVWPKPAQFEESFEEIFETSTAPIHPSPIDHLEKEAWTTEVMDACLTTTASSRYSRPIDPEAEAATRIDPPLLLEIVDQFIRTDIAYERGDEKKKFHSPKILAVVGRFKHPSGEAVTVQVDLHRLKGGRNCDYYQEQILRFFAKEKALSTRR